MTAVSPHCQVCVRAILHDGKINEAQIGVISILRLKLELIFAEVNEITIHLKKEGNRFVRSTLVTLKVFCLCIFVQLLLSAANVLMLLLEVELFELCCCAVT